jgi:hypothetical protein
MPPAVPGLPVNLGAVATSLTHNAQYDSTFIAAAYQTFLGRSTDASGLSYWVAQMQAGTTDEGLDAALLASSEYVTLHGGANIFWVMAMYQDLLGRPADVQGLSYWLGQLEAEAGRYQIALDIASSAEREAIVVTNDYQNFLGRTASPGEIAYWVNAFEQGTQNEDVITGFIASPEYYNSSAKGQGSSAAWIDSVFQDLYQTPPTASQLALLLVQLD